MNKTRRLILVISLLLVAVMAVGVVAPSFLLVALAAFVLFVLILPLIRSTEIDWFAPWSFVLYSAFVGVFLRAIYITFDLPSSSAIDQVFLLGESKDFLIWPMILLLLGMSFLTLGYLAASSRINKLSLRVFQSSEWHRKRFVVAIVVMLVISWLGLYLYMDTWGESFSLEKISAIRGVAVDLSEYHSYSYYMWMISLSQLVCYLLLVELISTRRVQVLYIGIFLLAFVTALFGLIYSSSRGGGLFVLINLVAIAYYTRGKKINIGSILKLAAIGIVALLLFKTLTGLRNGKDLAEAMAPSSNVAELLEPIVLTTNLIDVSKTAHIIAAIPNKIDYQWGQTLITIFVAWIPREMWPDKPVVYVDNTLGIAVFGATVYGAGAVPPGLVAEMYWNFSIPGVLLGSFGIGYLLKRIYSLFKAYSKNRNIVLLYVTSCMPLGMAFIGSSFTSTEVSFLTYFLPLYVVLHIITKRTPSLVPLQSQ